MANNQEGISNGAKTGIGMLNVMANVAYAGMRAQNSPNQLGRFFAFFVGFPGTLITYFAVKQGSNRAYGVQLPTKRSIQYQFQKLLKKSRQNGYR